MSLPFSLQNAIEKLAGSLKINDLAQSSKNLSESYRRTSESKKIILNGEKQRLTYLVTRMPATFAAISKVLGHFLSRFPEIAIDSLLDVGAGPGTGMWSAEQTFQALQKITLLEKDPLFIKLGKILAGASDSQVLKEAEWKEVDLRSYISSNSYDLVLMSYAMNEISENQESGILKNLWQCTKKIFILIEPGTPVGFKRILKMRQTLLNWGAYLVAPCPHSGSCPLKEGDWCHFYARLQRSSLHRRTKEASLNYEDEKFSYLIFSKIPLPKVDAKIILRHPQIKSGHVNLTLCSQDGIKNCTVSRKDKENYTRARASEWGDIF